MPHSGYTYRLHDQLNGGCKHTAAKYFFADKDQGQGTDYGQFWWSSKFKYLLLMHVAKIVGLTIKQQQRL